MQVWWRSSHWFRRQSLEKTDFTFLNVGDLKSWVDLKIRSRSPRSYQLSILHNDTIHKLSKIPLFNSRDVIQIPYFGQNLSFQSADVKLKIRLRSQKSNQT